MAKKVFKVDGNKFTEWQAPDEEIIVKPFTEVVPPDATDKMIISFNWITNQWETVDVVSKEDFDATNEALVELAQKISDLEKKGE